MAILRTNSPKCQFKNCLKVEILRTVLSGNFKNGLISLVALQRTLKIAKSGKSMFTQ